MRRRHRVLPLAVVLTLLAPIGVGVATGQEDAGLPDELAAAASAAGVSFVQMKQPNPLPVGPGAFLTFELPEVAGGMTASASTARTSLVYPGPVVAGLPALLCTAGATPFCGQAPPPVVAEAQHPQTPDASLRTDGLSFREPSVPLSTGAGSGEAHVTATTSRSTAVLGEYRLGAPEEAQQAILDALRATLESIPGAKLAEDTALVAVGGGRASQTIEPAGEGRIRTEAVARINDVRLLAGAVTIDSVIVSAFSVTDGDTVRESGSKTSTSGVLVGGFPATIGPEGFSINGSGDGGQGRQQLNGVAGRIADAVATATQKLELEVRDGGASRDDAGGAAADGLRISLSNAALTDTSPPQVAALCTVTGAIQDPISAGGLALPPICAVPDLTGTSDSYEILLGRASVTLTAQRFPDLGEGVGDLAGAAGDLGGSLGGVGGGVGSSTGDGAAGSSGTGRGSSGGRRGTSSVDPRQPGFLQLEAKWLGGARAADRFGDVYLALAGMATLLLLASRVVLRFTRTDFPKEG